MVALLTKTNASYAPAAARWESEPRRHVRAPNITGVREWDQSGIGFVICQGEFLISTTVLFEIFNRAAMRLRKV